MKLLVTGATGFTGSYTVPRLLEHGYDVRCLVRPTSDRSSLSTTGIEWVAGDVEDRESLALALQDIDALVNIVSLGFGHAPNIVGAANDVGITRAVFISTTAIFTTLNAPSKKVRLHAEQVVKKSGLDYTILRPTMIYGSSRDRNMCRLIRYLKRYPLIPICGDGASLQQPIYVDDLAKAIASVLQTKATIGKAYNVSGSAPLSYNHVIETIGKLLNRRILRLHVPASPIIRLLQTTEWLHLKLPVSSEQVQRLNENKAFDWTEAHRDFGYQPRSFEEGIKLELKEMAIHG